MEDQTFEQDPELAAELRQGAGREWAEEAAEDERLTALHDRRRLNLADLAKEMVNTGARVSVDFGGHNFSGAVVGAGADYAVVEGSGQHAEIRLDAAYWSLIPAVTPGTAGVATNETLKARLAEHADQGNMLRLALPGGELAIGRVVVVADDHIEVADADERQLYLPLNLIVGIIRSAEIH